MIGIVQLNANPPPPRLWSVELIKLGFDWDRTEPQPIADQIKLHNLTGDPENAPDWLEIVK